MRKNWRKFLTAATATVLMMILAGCGTVKEANAAFDTMMQAFQTGDKTQISQYYDFDSVSNFINAEDSEQLQNAILSTLKQMSYKVEASEKMEDGSVKLQVKVTTLDFSDVMKRYMDQVMQMVASAEYQAKVSEMTQEEYQKQLANCMLNVLAQTDIPSTENTIEVTMIENDGSWQIGGDKDAFLGALFANLSDAVNSLI